MENKSKNYLIRFCIAAVLILAPLIFLLNGIFGSLLFSFSVPLLWQVVYRGDPLSSLGVRGKNLSVSVVSGLVSGVILGLTGGKVLQIMGLTGFSLEKMRELTFCWGMFNIDFSPANELGYRLLTQANGFTGLMTYFLFSVFVIGLGEEILWRGFIQAKISKRVDKTKAILTTAVLFALAHLYLFLIVPFNKGIILIALIATAAAIWGYLYDKTANIWSVALSHGIAAFLVWKYYFFK